ncbi:MAG: tetratricopeptide repeat protein [Pseudomonadota bacterium]
MSTEPEKKPRLIDDVLASRLERRLRTVISFGSLHFHPPAFGSEFFFDGRSLSFPLKRAGTDIALVVLEGVDESPDPERLLAVCTELFSADVPAGARRRPPGGEDPPHVLSVLPLGKLVLALRGEVWPGQRVLIWERNNLGQPVCKAEAQIVSVEAGEALAQIISRGEPFVRVRPGDVVAPVVTEGERPLEPAGRGIEAFKAALAREWSAWDGLAVLMARLDGAGTIRNRLGTSRLEKLLSDMSGILLSFGGPGCVVGREGIELLLAGFPGKTAEQALEVHPRLADLGRALSATVTAGSAAYPGWDFPKDELVGNAAKALEHARLLGAGQTACFNAVSLNVSGDVLYERGDLEGAAKEYLRALEEIDPDDTNLLNSLGVCYADLGDFEAAKIQFNKAVAARPEEVMAHYNVGFAHLRQGERQEALASFQAAMRLDPANFEVRFQLGKLMLEEGRAAEAKEHLLAAARVESRPYIHRHLGDCLLLLGETADAASHYKRAVRANPEDAHSLSQLAAVCLEQGTDLDVAISLLKKAMEIQPGSPIHHERLESVLARLPKKEQLKLSLDTPEG